MQNEEAVKKIIEAVWNQKKTGAVGDHFQKEAVIHGPHGEIYGHEEIKKFISSLVEGFPDIQFNIQEMFSNNNRVVVRWEAKGTHKGVFLKNAPTGKHVHFKGISIFHLENGKVKEYWFNSDLYGLLRQLGVIEAPAAH